MNSFSRMISSRKHRFRPCVEAMECRIALSNVSLLINNSASPADDLTLYNPPNSAEPFVQTVPMKVTNNGPAITLKLVVVPAGAVTLSSNTLTIPSNGSAQVVITPASVSKAVGDIKIEATDPMNKVEASRTMTDVSVIVPQAVRNKDTPAQMASNRIPPRTTTTLPVTVTPKLNKNDLFVALTSTGQSNNDGTFALDGKKVVDLTKTTDIALKGITQTEATAGSGGGNAGNLKLTVNVRGQDTVNSGGFSVAAIPETWKITFKSLIKTGSTLGIDVGDKWKSDSGDVADLKPP